LTLFGRKSGWWDRWGGNSKKTIDLLNVYKHGRRGRGCKEKKSLFQNKGWGLFRLQDVMRRANRWGVWDWLPRTEGGGGL